MSYTNTGLSTFRRCAREFELRYEKQLEPDLDDREVLLVGSSWHKAHEWKSKGLDPYEAIRLSAPSEKWVVKLSRLFAAHEWYWASQPLLVIIPEATFAVTIDAIDYEGQIDAVIGLEDGRRGIHEYKTTSDSVGGESSYWDKLRLDVQVGLYSLAQGARPDFILYDVVRKPTINPKRLTKADVKRLSAELNDVGSAVYFDETFDTDHVTQALQDGAESLEMYGARLTADIGNDPTKYFARRPVERTEDDYANLLDDLSSTVQLIEHAREVGFPRNPDACNAFGRCSFFALCSNNVHPTASTGVPDGFRRREHLHPELVRNEDTNE